METLRVENFLGLNLKIDSSQLNVFIGPQASGKSVVVKLFYYFKKAFNQLLNSIEENDKRYGYSKRMKNIFKEYFPPPAWGKEDFKIMYTIHQFEIVVKFQSGKLLFEPCKEFKHSHYYLKRRFKKHLENLHSKGGISDIPRLRLRNKLFSIFTTKFPKDALSHPIFVPAGRSFFAILQNSIFSFLSSNNAIDPFLKEFGIFYESIKPFIDRYHSDEKEPHIVTLKKMSQLLLCGRYKQEKTRDVLLLNSGRKVDVAYSSSGQQEILPLALILRVLPKIRFLEPTTSLFLEEPEAHIFPKAQRTFIEFLLLAIHQSSSNIQVFITTHSPYILSAINNLIEADKLKPEDKKKIGIHPSATISPKSIAAWSFEDGKVRSIFDDTNDLILAGEIDKISDDLAIEYEKIITLGESL